MALQNNITKDVYGVKTTFKDAYFRVVRIVQFSKDDGCSFDVEVYRNKEYSDNRMSPIEGIGVHFPYNARINDPILKECYNYLKTLPEFKDAIDC